MLLKIPNLPPLKYYFIATNVHQKYKEYKLILRNHNLKVVYNEYIYKTYKGGKDTFVFNVLEAIR